jgi:ankyrin repeat protein
MRSIAGIWRADMSPDWEAAARAGHVARLEELLRRGADVNARDRHGQTAVMLAAHAGHSAAVELLARAGADLNHTAKFGLPALMLAVVAGHVETAAALIEAGADVTIVSAGAPGFAGRTARDLAVARGYDRLVDLIDHLQAR